MNTVLVDYYPLQYQDGITVSTSNPSISFTANLYQPITSPGTPIGLVFNEISFNNFLKQFKQNIIVGTGGSLLVYRITNTRTTGGNLYGVQFPSGEAKDRKSEFVCDVGEILSFIRSSLSLTVIEMAKILRVERQTIYAWIGGSSEPHPSNRSRLNKIYSIAKYWETLSSLPVGNFVRQFCRNGKSLLDLLSEDVLEKKEIQAHLKLLLEDISKGKTSRKKQSKPSMRELAAKHNSKVSENNDTIDWLTGKRIGLE